LPQAQYLESDAGHWVPPELIPVAQEFVRVSRASAG
ncbi:MAG: hypothetical protein QOD86_1001, partial [Miltoncostaeaceae bacterium]|nr:hypothetical protein [Miltoncostaeaceae bacterium]